MSTQIALIYAFAAGVSLRSLGNIRGCQHLGISWMWATSAAVDGFGMYRHLGEDHGNGARMER